METKAREPYLDEDHLYNKYELLKMANERNMKEKFEFKKRVEELESALQGARAHAEVMEHKATRVNAMLRDREAENKKLREALEMQPCDCYQIESDHEICQRCEALGEVGE